MSLTPAAIKRYDQQAPSTDRTETATVALGCFWGPDAQFGALDGVVRTRVGYAGGSIADPSYHDLGDHTEALQVDYDPSARSFESLVDLALRSHDHARQPTKTQYQNILFASTPAQAETIGAVLDARGLTRDGIETRIEPLDSFFLAEPYHQKHSLRGRQSLLSSFKQAGYDADELRESPAAAKCNAYAAGRELPDGNAFGGSSNRTVH